MVCPASKNARTASGYLRAQSPTTKTVALALYHQRRRKQQRQHHKNRPFGQQDISHNAHPLPFFPYHIYGEGTKKRRSKPQPSKKRTVLLVRRCVFAFLSLLPEEISDYGEPFADDEGRQGECPRTSADLISRKPVFFGEQSCAELVKIGGNQHHRAAQIR